MRWAAVALAVTVARSPVPTPPQTIFPVLWVVQTPQDMIVEESLRIGVNPHWPLYIGWRESRYTPNLISPTRDYGVMQLHWTTVRALGLTNPLDARANIRAGVGLWAHWLRVCGTEAAAMHAYAKGRCL